MARVADFRRQLDALAEDFENLYSEFVELTQESNRLRNLHPGAEPFSQKTSEAEENTFCAAGTKESRQSAAFEPLEARGNSVVNGFDQGLQLKWKHAADGSRFSPANDEVLDEHPAYLSSSWEQVNHTVKPCVTSLDPATLVVEVSELGDLEEDEDYYRSQAESLDEDPGSEPRQQMSSAEETYFLDSDPSASMNYNTNTRDVPVVNKYSSERGSIADMMSAPLDHRMSWVEGMVMQQGSTKDFTRSEGVFARIRSTASASAAVMGRMQYGRGKLDPLLVWGLCAFVCLLLELWLVSFELVFLEKYDTPRAVELTLHGLGIFLAVDILINLGAFCCRGDETSISLLFFPRSYIWMWFSLDVSATVPALILLVADVQSSSLGYLSDNLNLSAMELLTGLRLIHAVRLARFARQAISIGMEDFEMNFRWILLLFFQAALILFFITHAHGCVWAALQPEWVTATTMIDAIRKYFHSFWWAYTAFTVGALGPRQTFATDAPEMWGLEIVMATERLVFFGLLAMQVLSSGPTAMRRVYSGGSSEATGRMQEPGPRTSRTSRFSKAMTSILTERRPSLTPSLVDVDSDSEEELMKEPDQWPGFRRGGVSAEACGAFNQRYHDREQDRKAKTSIPQTPEDRAVLIESLERLPFLNNVQRMGIEAIVDTMDVETIAGGASVYEKGDFGRSLYVAVSGMAATYRDREDRTARRFLHPKDLFGELTMLWGFRRENSVRADGEFKVGKLKRDHFFHLVTQHELIKNTQKQSILRKVRLFDMLNDEMICKLADVLERRSYPAGTKIVAQDDDASNELFLLWDGMCVATTSRQSAIPREMRRLQKGEYFGESGFLREGPSVYSVTALGKVKVLVLSSKKFTRLFGDFQTLAEECLKRDPRTAIADFYKPGDKYGPRGLNARVTYENMAKSDRSEWFAIFRPTSRDAIAKMIDGSAVGKGLNVKGKSSKMNHLSGYVPFIQISNNDHKESVEESPADALTTVYFQSKWARSLALQVLERLLEPSPESVVSGKIVFDDSYEGVFGLIVPEAAIREAYIMQPDIRYPQGWDSGRPSEPAYMNMNLHSARSDSEPKVVLYQFDQLDPLNPHGLLIAYAERSVKPVVSDFDLFTVGCKGVKFDTPLDSSQSDIAVWMLKNAREVLPKLKEEGKTWSSRWLEVMSEWRDQGFYPETPKYGFGDRLSSSLVSAIVQRTKDSGAVRHGAECFNLYFPQELDTDYLIVWEGFESRWEYLEEADMREFLKDRVSEGFSFPLNPVWPIRDAGWFDLYNALKKKRASTFDCWYPAGSGIRELIDSIREEQTAETTKESGEQHRRRLNRLQTRRKLASVIGMSG